ncbi:MAG: hypothetical protein LBQ48_04500 [Oscillospiraceae bacterium]|nr:hypothetical protein [Oscillospiraceae bacterium]
MAGFFGLFDYTKAGPGVEKNAPVKNRFFVFWEVLFRKFWKIVLVNLLFFAFLLPVAAACWGLIVLFAGLGLNTMFSVLAFFPAILMGPVTAGVMRLTRDFAREEPVFLWSDFKQTVRNNFKRSLAIAALQYLAALALWAAVPFYYANSSGNFLFLILFFLSLLVCFLVLFMSFYVYIMQVTLNLTFKKLLKNAALFSMLCLFKNLLITLVTLAVTVLFASALLIGNLGIPIFTVLFGGLYFGLVFFVISFVTFPSIQRYIITPYYESHPEETARAVTDKKALPGGGEEENAEEPERPLPEYVYENGRMVHRSVIENTFEDEDGEV